MEVVELLEPNSGREPFTFLKRGPLPRGGAAPALGAHPDPTALVQPADLRLGAFLQVHGRPFYLFNMDAATRAWYRVSPEGGRGGGCCWLHRGCSAWWLLGVGDCGAAAPCRLAVHPLPPTPPSAMKEHLDASPEELAPIDVSEPAAPLPVPALPPWNGYGSHEDSMQNVKRLVPVPPKRDLYKARETQGGFVFVLTIFHRILVSPFPPPPAPPLL